MKPRQLVKFSFGLFLIAVCTVLLGCASSGSRMYDGPARPDSEVAWVDFYWVWLFLAARF